MKSKLPMIAGLACALAMIAIIASCKKPVDTATSLSNPAGQGAAFPGGAPITPADLTATPAALPSPPPAYDPNFCGSNQLLCRQQYAYFAWRQFIYLNSPAQRTGGLPGTLPVKRGMVDPHDNFVTSGDPNFYQSGRVHNANLSNNLLVWETFAHRSELFPAGASPKGDLTTLTPRYIFSNISVDDDDTQVRFNNLDEVTQIGQNQLFFPSDGKRPSAYPYDDCIVLFQAKVNNAEYNYISKIYNAGNPPRNIELPPNTGNPKLDPQTWSDDETIEIKSAWRDMTCGSVDPTRYHTAHAVYYESNANPPSRVGNFGLIGLHILRKMKNYPAFIYTTFEHVDNLNSGAYFITLYNDMEYSPAIDNPMAIVNDGTKRFSVKLPGAGAVGPKGYPFVPGATLPPRLADFAGPIMAEPSPALTKAVTDVNAEVVAAMARLPEFNKSVWMNYRLAGVQILPVNEDSSTSGTPDPLTEDFFLANNVIESSRPGVQLFKGGVSDPNMRGAGPHQLLNLRSEANIQNVWELPNANQVVMGGCMGCHGNARYPTDKEGVALDPSASSTFNFLINYSTTMQGTGFSADTRNEPPEELKAKASKYMRRIK